MGAVSGNEQMVARTKLALPFTLDVEARRAGEEQDPFVMPLPMRFIRRSGLTGRDDALDPHTLA